MPLVSVVIPTHNRPQMLAEALASVRAQTFTDYEIIVVSNGESDEMRRQSRCAARLCDASYVALDDGNLAAARNFAIGRANGEWIAFLDDDDLWLPDKLERQLAAARQTGADLVACDFVAVYPDGHEVIGHRRSPDGWCYVRALSHDYIGPAPSATMVRKNVFIETGGFDCGLRYWGEETDMWRRISWRHRICEMDEPLMRYRTGHPSMTRRPAFYEFHRYLKMRRDTPADLRWALPSIWTFLLPRLAAELLRLASGPLRRPHPWLRPRTRWLAFQRWLAG